MNLPSVPGPEAALLKIAPLSPLLHERFEGSIQEAREFFDSRGLAVDPYLFPHLVRFFVKQSLANSGQAVEYELDDLASSGLRLAFEDWDVRILKAAYFPVDGQYLLNLPAPGKSEAKQKFYKQQLELWPNGDGEPRTIRLNAVILWDVTSGWNFSGLFLAIPKNGGDYRASVETYWPIVQIPPPLPAATVEPEPVPPEDLPELESIPAPTGSSDND